MFLSSIVNLAQLVSSSVALIAKLVSVLKHFWENSHIILKSFIQFCYSIETILKDFFDNFETIEITLR